MDNVNKAIVTVISLVPFVKYVISYFMSLKNENEDQLNSTLLKCAPIFCLVIFIFLICYSFEDLHYNLYSERIVYGLLFSCAGDAFLNYDLFPQGMVAFGIAHGWYIYAFGFSQFNWSIGLPLYFLASCFMAFIYQYLDMVVAFGLPMYTFLLVGMSWRALSNAVEQKDFISRACALGSILFLISDILIALDKYYMAIPDAKIYIMSTYYAAQLGIALSILNGAQMPEEDDEEEEDQAIEN